LEESISPLSTLNSAVQLASPSSGNYSGSGTSSPTYDLNYQFNKENFPSLLDVLKGQEQLKLNLDHVNKKQRSNETINENTVIIPKNNQIDEVISVQQTKSSPSGQMEKFPISQLVDFKHVIYNLLVDQYNDPSSTSLMISIREDKNGYVRTGFRFNVDQQPEKKLAELYAKHVRKVDLEKENLHNTVAQDLYKFYFRSSIELLAKYFEKRDKFTFFDIDVPLFIGGEYLDDADDRLRNIRVRGRKRKADPNN